MDNLKEATLQSELRFKDLVINPCHRSVLINNNRILVVLIHRFLKP